MGLEEHPAWAEHPDLVAFYTQHRNSPNDLYKSERRFLPWLASQVASVLDTGCAAGGFRDIWRHYRPDVSYSGVDVSASLIGAARRLHPDCRFEVGDCTSGLDMPDQCATVVQALGWLNWEPRYPRAIRELWRLTRRYLFLDVRLAAGPEEGLVGRQRLALAGQWDGQTTTPYVVVPWPTFAGLLVDLEPLRILAYGYWGKPADTVVGVQSEVCFATFVIEKASTAQSPSRPTVCAEMPLQWPAALSSRLEVLPAEHLATLAPAM